MKQIVIKITDAFYEKVMRHEVNAPTQLIEAVRQGKEPNSGALSRKVSYTMPV